MHDDAAKFIEGYRDAFSRGPRAMAELYAEPCVTVRMGVVQVHATRADTERFFAEVEATYRTRGCTDGDIRRVDVQPLGANSALATVQWAYKGACAELLWTTTFSYNLCRREDRWEIVVQTMHD